MDINLLNTLQIPVESNNSSNPLVLNEVDAELFAQTLNELNDTNNVYLSSELDLPTLLIQNPQDITKSLVVKNKSSLDSINLIHTPSNDKEKLNYLDTLQDPLLWQVVAAQSNNGNQEGHYTKLLQSDDSFLEQMLVDKQIQVSPSQHHLQKLFQSHLSTNLENNAINVVLPQSNEIKLTDVALGLTANDNRSITTVFKSLVNITDNLEVKNENTIESMPGFLATEENIINTTKEIFNKTLHVTHSKTFTEDLMQQILSFRQNDIKSAEIELQPSGLGKMEIVLKMEGDKTFVSFHTDQLEARNALATNIDRLRLMMQSEGFVLSGFDIAHQRDGKNYLFEQNKQAIAIDNSSITTPHHFISRIANPQNLIDVYV